MKNPNKAKKQKNKKGENNTKETSHEVENNSDLSEYEHNEGEDDCFKKFEGGLPPPLDFLDFSADSSAVVEELKFREGEMAIRKSKVAAAAVVSTSNLPDSKLSNVFSASSSVKPLVVTVTLSSIQTQVPTLSSINSTFVTSTSVASSSVPLTPVLGYTRRSSLTVDTSSLPDKYSPVMTVEDGSASKTSVSETKDHHKKVASNNASFGDMSSFHKKTTSASVFTGSSHQKTFSDTQTASNLFSGTPINYHKNAASDSDSSVFDHKKKQTDSSKFAQFLSKLENNKITICNFSEELPENDSGQDLRNVKSEKFQTILTALSKNTSITKFKLGLNVSFQEENPILPELLNSLKSNKVTSLDISGYRINGKVVNDTAPNRAQKPKSEKTVLKLLKFVERKSEKPENLKENEDLKQNMAVTLVNFLQERANNSQLTKIHSLNVTNTKIEFETLKIILETTPVTQLFYDPIPDDSRNEKKTEIEKLLKNNIAKELSGFLIAKQLLELKEVDKAVFMNDKSLSEGVRNFLASTKLQDVNDLLRSNKATTELPQSLKVQVDNPNLLTPTNTPTATPIPSLSPTATENNGALMPPSSLPTPPLTPTSPSPSPTAVKICLAHHSTDGASVFK